MYTDFAGNITHIKTVWAKKLWEAARDGMFVNRFVGDDENAMIQRVTELTRTEKGEEAVIQLVADLVGDGRANDDEREGFEEAMQNYEAAFTIGLITHSVRNKGKLADQKTTINFRALGFNKLKFWLQNRMDQLALLTLSGIGYGYNLDGSLRTETAFPALKFANDVTPPSSKRALMWDGTNLIPSVTANVTSAFVPSYKMIVKAMAYAKTHYIRPLMSGGKAYYTMVMPPASLAALKMDDNYQRAVVAVATKQGLDSPFFTGAQVTVDGAVIHETNMAYNTAGLADGSKWGSGGHVDGARIMVCGAQALGMLDLGDPDWVEKRFQFDSQGAINVDKMLSFLKPQFYSNYDKSVQDFGCFAIDTYLPA